MTLLSGGLLGSGQTSANDTVHVTLTPVGGVSVTGSSQAGSSDQPRLQIDLTSTTTGDTLLSGVLGQDDLLNLSNLFASGNTPTLGDLLNSIDSGLVDVGSILGTPEQPLDLSNLVNLNSLLNPVDHVIDGGTAVVNRDLSNLLTLSGIDITNYHPPGTGPTPPNNPGPGTGSAGVQIIHTVNGDVLIGTPDNDTMTGNVGNDHFFGLGGNDTIDGREGIDTSFYRSARNDFTVSTANGVITVSDHTVTRDGTDTLQNIERLAFTDSTLAFDINGDAGQVYRLYQAAFDRTPDQGGLSYWVTRLDGPETLKQIAQQFIASDEFHALYGQNPNEATFVNALYMNVLDRRADANGQAFWQNAMAHGQSRADVLVSFSESAENHAHVDPGLQSGILLDYGVYV